MLFQHVPQDVVVVVVVVWCGGVGVGESLWIEVKNFTAVPGVSQPSPQGPICKVLRISAYPFTPTPHTHSGHTSA